MNNFFQSHPRRGVFRNVDVSNLKNIRTDRTGECIFRAFGGKYLQNFPLAPIMMASLWVRYMSCYAQKNSGYVSNEVKKGCFCFQTATTKRIYSIFK